MKRVLDDVKLFLEKIDGLRDKVLFVIIKPFWPRKVLPNHLTVARIIIGIILFILLFYYRNDSGTLIISLFLAGALTDLLDGSVARGLNEETKLGAAIDPIADRILIIPIAIYSLITSHSLLLLLLISLEIINAIGSMYGKGKGVFLKSNIFGKIKMVLQSIVFGVILIFWPKPPNIFLIYMLWFSVVLIIVSIYVKFLEIKNSARL